MTVKMVWIERDQWPVNWPPSASYIASWDPNKLSYVQICCKGVQLTRVECPLGKIARTGSDGSG